MVAQSNNALLYRGHGFNYMFLKVINIRLYRFYISVLKHASLMLDSHPMCG